MDSTQELWLQGLPISDGVALARVCHIEVRRKAPVPSYRINASGVVAEQARLSGVLLAAAEQLDMLVEAVTQRIGTAQANIFVAQKMIVEDPVLADEMRALIASEEINAESAIDKVLDRYESILQEVDDEYIKERASDIGEIRRRLIDLLRDPSAQSTALDSLPEIAEGSARIVVAEELSPGETVALADKNVEGLITEHGGTASHASILARSLGIPAISGIEGVCEALPDGALVLLNGTTGELVLNPSHATTRLYPSTRRVAHRPVATVPRVPGFQVRANINLVTDLDQAAAAQAEGIGLYRTEFEFFAAGRILNEEEQYVRYAAVVAAMAGQAVHVRLLDLGGDKALPSLKLPREDNPCLGLRGARLLEEMPELLIPQARALARASIQGPIHVIYPMIVDRDQFLRLRELLCQSISDIEGAQLHHGVMFEVPSACLSAHAIFEVAEFGCIGSNDLVQYLFAVDRNNDRVAGHYSPDRPVFWQVIGNLAAAAAESGRPLSLCGEIGSQPRYLPMLIDLGVRCVSVSPRMVGLARTAATRHTRLSSSRTPHVWHSPLGVDKVAFRFREEGVTQDDQQEDSRSGKRTD